MKLDFDKAEKIRKVYRENEDVTLRQLAEKYGVSTTCIFLIVNNRAWVKPRPPAVQRVRKQYVKGMPWSRA